MRRRAGAVALVTVVALAGAACSGGDGTDAGTGGGPGTGRPATTTTAAPPGAPPEYVAHPGDWVLPGADYDNTRRAPASRITSENVDRLQPAWEAEVGGALSTVPLIVGDTVYVQDGSTAIHAFDRATGATRWTAAGTGFSIGPFGVAVADGRVFGVHGSDGIRAVDAGTGEELWTRRITATPTGGVDIQPLVYGDLVLVSTVPVSVGGIYAGGDRGILHALDAATGQDRWTFDTVDSPDVWGNPRVNSGGGAWYPPAVDPGRGVVHWGVANPAPFPGTPEFPNGSSRPGDNLYTNSVLTLGIEDGALRWYHQVHPHDLFDRDLVHTMIVRDAERGDTVIGTGKGGVVVGLDPRTGERRWRTEVGVHRNDDLTRLEGPTEVAPGTYGGVLTPPATADGVVYVATVDSPVELRPDETAYFGAPMGVNDGEVTAIDAATGDVLWEADVPGDPLGGVAVVNDLLFTALLDGTVLALDRDDGAIVWRTTAPGGINGWMTAADDLLVVPAGNATPPRLVAYRLPPGDGSG